MSVHEAISKVMEAVRAVGKDDRNNQQNFNFRGVDAVVNAIGPAMRNNGLTVRPSNVLSIEYIPFTTKSGALGVSCRILVEYTFTDLQGDSCTSVVAAEANDYGDKATPKAMSVAFRTCLLQAFALPTNDTDPDSESYELGHPQAATPPASRTMQRPTVDMDAWKARIGARDSMAGLRGLYNEAQQEGAPESVLSLIVADGNRRFPEDVKK